MNARNGATGVYLLAANDGSYGVNNIAGINNSLDCCNLCATTADCSVSIYTAASGGCYQLSNCGLHFPAVQDGSYDWVVNNGCGEAVPN
ncbi:hypothetical protein DOTSEDRAFT_72256 [Dothistroma septosporum NZE10]|uniref:Apple domain-containing protein n=1 Tax=Dothistroma septosporum (strain NZE10 / CBS 128990) TaxID=675120 RepID=N1PQN8_DOTSN|nr:hypothetical protein DOTSEDRAFT_72256 [Dothistroma septosporum NZE10]